MWVRLEEGQCRESVPFDPKGVYPAALSWMPVPEALQPYFDCRYRLCEGKLVPPSLAYLRDQIATRLATRRYLAEESGVTVTLTEGRAEPVSVRIDTSRAARPNLLGAALGAQLDPMATLAWKDAKGQFVEVTSPEILHMASCALGHVQACYAHEASIRALLDAAEDQEALLEAAKRIETGWPS